MCCNCCSVLQQKIWIITLGIVCVVSGIVFIFFSHKAADAVADAYLPLSPNSWMLNKWLNPPSTTYMYVYLFNWTNSHEATNPNVKPNFVQHGPYVYSEDRSKEDIVWHDNDTMTYYNRRTWFFEEEMSGSSLDDVIILPHPPTVITAKLVQNMNRYMKKIVNYALKTEGGLLAAKQTADEWVFKGFKDPLTDLAAIFASKILPINLERFGLFTIRNASKTYEGRYSISTGQKKISSLGDLVKWRGRNVSKAYEGECSRINGSTGDIFSPRRNEDDVISFFLPDTCRSINLFPKEKLIYRDIESIKYETTDMTFDSGEIYSNMKCFCTKEDRSKCPRTGVIEMGSCLLGAPAYLSLPHFYKADPSFRSAITGMNPDPKEHEFYMIMEPKVGAPINGNGNMQINLLIEPDDTIEIFKNVNEFYAPFIIISERGDLDESYASLVRLYLKSGNIGVALGYVLLVIGLILLAIFFYLNYTNKWRNWNREKDDSTKK